MRSTAGAGIPESLDRTSQAGNSPDLLALLDSEAGFCGAQSQYAPELPQLR